MMKNYWETGVRVIISGKDLHYDLMMPEAPRKGDFLWISSLTRGAYSKIYEAQVSKVEWVMDQTSGVISAWLTVRRTKVAKDKLDESDNS